MCRKHVFVVMAVVFVLTLAVSASAKPEISAQPDNGEAALDQRIARLEAQVEEAQRGADNGWILVSSALVLMMTGPGLALFYGGLVRKKNVLSTMMQSFFYCDMWMK